VAAVNSFDRLPLRLLVGVPHCERPPEAVAVACLEFIDGPLREKPATDPATAAV